MQFCFISLPGVSVHDNQWTSSSDSWCWCWSQRAWRTGTYQLTPNYLFISLLQTQLPAEPQFTKAPTYNKALGHLFKSLWNQHSYSAKAWPVLSQSRTLCHQTKPSSAEHVHTQPAIAMPLQWRAHAFNTEYSIQTVCISVFSIQALGFSICWRL